jgi:hypothetical protein
MAGKRKKRKKPKETWLERELRLRKRAEQKLGESTARFVYTMLKLRGLLPRRLEPPSLARLRAEDTENR